MEYIVIMTITKYNPNEVSHLIDPLVYKTMVIASRFMADDQIADYLNQLASGNRTPEVKPIGRY